MPGALMGDAHASYRVNLSRLFQLTHAASLHTLAGNFHSHTDQTSSVHPTDADQGTYNEQLYQCYPLDQPVQQYITYCL